jgi:hypothetical protein
MRWFVIFGGLVLLGQALHDTFWFAVGLFQSRYTPTKEIIISKDSFELVNRIV